MGNTLGRAAIVNTTTIKLTTRRDCEKKQDFFFLAWRHYSLLIAWLFLLTGVKNEEELVHALLPSPCQTGRGPNLQMVSTAHSYQLNEIAM